MDNKEMTKNADLEFLNAHYDEIYDAMVDDFDMNHQREMKMVFEWDCETDDISYKIQGKGIASCEWHCLEDVYYTPSDLSAHNGSGFFIDFSITKTDKKTGLECEIDDDVYETIAVRLEDDFDEFMRDYR